MSEYSTIIYILYFLIIIYIVLASIRLGVLLERLKQYNKNNKLLNWFLD